ncbi:MAG: hypothetical protein ABFQ95_06605 [Pseudomonadota bacterium]
MHLLNRISLVGKLKEDPHTLQIAPGKRHDLSPGSRRARFCTPSS